MKTEFIWEVIRYKLIKLIDIIMIKSDKSIEIILW